MNSNQDKAFNTLVEKAQGVLLRIIEEMSTVIVGQSNMLEKVIIGLVSNGHILLEGVPGLAKTLTIKTLAKTIQATFNRIQFTPDLLPADLIGTLMYNQKTGEFSTRKGPIFTNIVLADEINRAPSKVQSALLECMQEKQVTIGDETYELDLPFLVLATQNPIEHEGTYNLPEAQLDRFMFKIKIDYPSKEEECTIVSRMIENDNRNVKAIISKKDVVQIQNIIKKIYIDETLIKYIIEIINATRHPENYKLEKGILHYGASPRASIYLALSAKANALLKGRSFVLPEDIISVVYDVLRHRIILSYEAEADNLEAEHIITSILHEIPIP